MRLSCGASTPLQAPSPSRITRFRRTSLGERSTLSDTAGQRSRLAPAAQARFDRHAPELAACRRAVEARFADRDDQR